MFDNKLIILDIGGSGIPEKNKFIYSFNNKFLKIIKSDVNLHTSSEENEILLNNLFWSEEKQMNFNITKNLVSSSLYKPNYEILNDYINFDEHKITTVKSLNIKTIENSEKINDFNFLKIDAEGAELEILKGCGYKLDKVIGVEIEAQFVRRYVDSPLFDETHAFLIKKGFELYLINSESWIRDKNYINSVSNHKIVWGDFVYFKKIEDLEKLMSTSKEKNLIEKFIILLVLYNLFDEANYILRKLYEKKLLSGNLKNILNKFVKKNKASNLNIIFKSFMQLTYSIIILCVTIFFRKHRKKGLIFFKRTFRKFFFQIGNLFKLNDEYSVIRDIKL